MRRDFDGAKHRLLCSPDFTHEEKTLLEKVSLQIHHGDTMYTSSNAFHYLSVGLSASRCIFVKDTFQRFEPTPATSGRVCFRDAAAERRFRADAVKHGAHVALLRKVQS